MRVGRCGHRCRCRRACAPAPHPRPLGCAAPVCGMSPVPGSWSVGRVKNCPWPTITAVLLLLVLGRCLVSEALVLTLVLPFLCVLFDLANKGRATCASPLLNYQSQEVRLPGDSASVHTSLLWGGRTLPSQVLKTHRLPLRNHVARIS